jgi:hypothetical protein
VSQPCANIYADIVQTNRWLAVGTALTLSLISDVDWDSGNVTPFGIAYLCILAHAVSTWALEHTQGVLTPSLGGDTAMAVTTLGAACLGLPLYGFRRALVRFIQTVSERRRNRSDSSSIHPGQIYPLLRCPLFQFSHTPSIVLYNLSHLPPPFSKYHSRPVSPSLLSLGSSRHLRRSEPRTWPSVA